MYAVDVPPEVDYARVAGILEEGEQDGRWDYEASSIEAVATEPVTAREPQRHSPLPPSQLEFLSRKRAEYLEVQPALGALEERLLALGGVAVVFRTEPDVEALVAHGRVFDQPVECFAGDPGNCHVNVARLWSGSTYPDAAIATGWALTDDDQLWRQHSWLVEPERLIETTVTRDKYFGIVLSPAAARAFSHAVGAT